MYGIVAAPTLVRFDVTGVDDRGGVRTACHGGLGAVVSPTDRADYRQMTRQEALRYLVAHQRVLEAVMGRFTVLPVRFGTVLADNVEVRRLLQQGHMVCAAKLKELAGTRQTEVVVTWNLDKVFREIAAEEKIARAKAQAAGQPPGQVEAARIAVGKLVNASLQRRRAEVQACLLPRLRTIARDLAVNPLLDDSMVINVALLLDVARCQRLDQLLADLDHEFQGRLTFRCVGLLPPYSFATVAVEAPSFEAVDEARRQLRLGNRGTPGEIKHAYRTLAAQLHPDVNREDGAEARMAALTDAYRLLSAYAGGQLRDGPGGRTMAVFFDRVSVGRRLLISLVRQEASGSADGRR